MDRELYYDAGKATYAKAMKELWPSEWDHVNYETVGDHAQAMLGLFWLNRYHGKDMSPLAHWFIEQFEFYITLVYLLDDLRTFEQMMTCSVVFW